MTDLIVRGLTSPQLGNLVRWAQDGTITDPRAAALVRTLGMNAHLRRFVTRRWLALDETTGFRVRWHCPVFFEDGVSIESSQYGVEYSWRSWAQTQGVQEKFRISMPLAPGTQLRSEPLLGDRVTAAAVERSLRPVVLRALLGAHSIRFDVETIANERGRDLGFHISYVNYGRTEIVTLNIALRAEFVHWLCGLPQDPFAPGVPEFPADLGGFGVPDPQLSLQAAREGLVEAQQFWYKALRRMIGAVHALPAFLHREEVRGPAYEQLAGVHVVPSPLVDELDLTGRVERNHVVGRKMLCIEPLWYGLQQSPGR
jgi:hypothetical protein